MSETIDDLVTRVYSGFRGVDMRGDEINLSRSPDSVNMWRNYKKLSGVETRPTMERMEATEGAVHGIFFFAGKMLVHCTDKLYAVENGVQTLLWEGLRQGRSDGFAYGEKWYFKDGTEYLEYDGETIARVEGYVPTTSIGRSPAGGGTTNEDVNMLTGRRINTFLADGESKEYFLDAQFIDEDFSPVVRVDGEKTEEFTVDYEAGKITFSSAPTAPLTDGQDNVSVEFQKTVSTYREAITGARMLQVFDNRVFFTGNPDYPNTVWHCSLNDPTYCSDLDYYTEGLDKAAIRGMVAGNNALWVFREPSAGNTTVFYHQPTLDSEYGKIYPSSHSSVATGCIGGAINFNDDILFFSDRGVEAVSGDITTEQVLQHRSSAVDRRLTAEPEYEDMTMAEWEGYLLIFAGKHVYLADSRAVYTNEDHVEYEWFYWEVEKTVLCACTQGGVLYLGTEEGIYTLTGNADVESHWVTPKDKFKYPHRQKTTNKRGCVVEAEGDVQVYARTEGKEFELVTTAENVTDYLVAAVKRKKFKDIQLKFQSETRFRLEQVSMECFIGGYIKR